MKLETQTAVEGKVASGEWKFFSVKVPARTNLLSVTLKGTRGDNLDMYVFPPGAKDTTQWRVAPKSRFSLEGALIEKPEGGSWRIGVFGSKVKFGGFQIVVDTKGKDFVRKGLRVKW